MKSEKGVTLTSVMIYVVAFTVIVLLIGRVTTYFYSNVQNVSSNTTANSEYTKFNSYFTAEINIANNHVEVCKDNYIIFSKTQTQYTYQNGKMYMDKAKICKDIDECTFSYNATTKVISVHIKIQGKDYSTDYTIVK